MISMPDKEVVKNQRFSRRLVFAANVGFFVYAMSGVVVFFSGTAPPSDPVDIRTYLILLAAALTLAFELWRNYEPDA